MPLHAEEKAAQEGYKAEATDPKPSLDAIGQALELLCKGLEAMPSDAREPLGLGGTELERFKELGKKVNQAAAPEELAQPVAPLPLAGTPPSVDVSMDVEEDDNFWTELELGHELGADARKRVAKVIGSHVNKRIKHRAAPYEGGSGRATPVA